MQVIKGWQNAHGLGPTALSIGTYDGVHRGHQRILARLIEVAKFEGLRSCLLTFDPHPRHALAKPSEEFVPLLTPLMERLERLTALGLDSVVVANFDNSLRSMPAQAYVEDILVNTLQARHLIVGYDHRFGNQRLGDYALLQRFSSGGAFILEQQEAILESDITISSTKIRAALSSGDMAKANAMLGYDYALAGSVVHGDHLGRTLGYPTANIDLSEQTKALPAFGVYAATVVADGNKHNALLSLGPRPALNSTELRIEAHLLNFSGDLYGQHIAIYPQHYLRPQIKFEGLDQLVKAMQVDEANARKWFANGENRAGVET